MNSIYLTYPPLLLAAAVILSLHIHTLTFPRLRTVLSVINTAVHIALMTSIFFLGGPVEDVLLTVLISAACALCVGRIEEGQS